MSNFEKFFSKDSTLNTSIALSMILYITAIACLLLMFTASTAYGFVTNALIFICLISLVGVYRKHATNAVNILTGAILMMFIAESLQFLIDSIVYFQQGIQLDFMTVLSIFNIVAIVLYIILFFNHVSINSLSHSAEKQVKANQIIFILILIFQLVYSVVSLITVIGDIMMASETTLYLVAVFATVLARLFGFSSIVCIETKLNMYKLLREKNTKDGTWTDEKKEQTKQDLFGE